MRAKGLIFNVGWWSWARGWQELQVDFKSLLNIEHWIEARFKSLPEKWSIMILFNALHCPAIGVLDIRLPHPLAQQLKLSSSTWAVSIAFASSWSTKLGLTLFAGWHDDRLRTKAPVASRQHSCQAFFFCVCCIACWTVCSYVSIIISDLNSIAVTYPALYTFVLIYQGPLAL